MRELFNYAGITLEHTPWERGREREREKVSCNNKSRDGCKISRLLLLSPSFIKRGLAIFGGEKIMINKSDVFINIINRAKEEGKRAREIIHWI